MKLVHDLSSFGQRLTYWMDKNGYGGWGGQKRFAEATGIKQQQLSRYMNDESHPSQTVRMKLAEAGLNLHWADTGQGPMSAPRSESGDDARIMVDPAEFGSVTFTVAEFMEYIAQKRKREGSDSFDQQPFDDSSM